ncbi:hypothetical protein VOLCADRAFT_94992 [Volvox carteri f. nagariensis]|uniref:Uncharacterized protein n=1 Tax=Volvox carteri f. nagariensis TaxID=3068 RepID=D8U6B4_VOLCA|nr:uncharacterized protein VOLCADRAFT_94992 [Volvox carteri f. nagariensis]EFJ44617.1 hypothetical protein VOLCADRAFT_94992 [Volvox carteri f. nagariensis]|eukprot:XP_002954193.1 hypothetical protein VOLCADRAFT_94992 [Volvox carteri f. nagariensis]
MTNTKPTSTHTRPRPLSFPPADFSSSSSAWDIQFDPTPEQRRQLPLLTSLLRRPGDQAQRLGALTALSASFRDLAVATTALQMRQHDLEPRADNHTDLAHQLKLQETTATRDNEPAAAATAAADVTMLPEDVAVDGRSEAPAAPRYDVSYMDKISCWAAMQPSHIEVSQPLMTGIQLFPPLEAAYPTYVDFDAATRLLSHRTSRKRLRLQRRLLRKQDKYQIKTWDHYAGSA